MVGVNEVVHVERFEAQFDWGDHARHGQHGAGTALELLVADRLTGATFWSRVPAYGECMWVKRG
jgi:hypothetical protein